MWICNDCGAVFENPREYYEHDTGYHGMECPHCGSDDIDEAERCAECDEWVNENNLVNGLCPACIERHASDYETVKAYGADRKEAVEINGFLAWVYSPEEIEEVLYRDLRKTETLKTNYAKRFATDDPDDFTDWLNERSAE